MENTTGFSNTAVGFESLKNGNHYQNTAVGTKALTNNDENDNTAIGAYSLFANTSGRQNTGLGSATLSYNIDGFNNSAVGYNALWANTSGTGNTSVGAFALSLNSTGGENSALGVGALENNRQGIQNTAVGSTALLVNETGSYNTAVGYQAIYNATGSWSTAVGYKALLNATTGQANVGIGYQALQYNLTGNNNTVVGTDAGPVSGSSFLSNSSAIGRTAVYTASNQVTIGNTLVNYIGGYSIWHNLSDIRFKKNIQPETHGLDFILKLEPITYNLDVKKLNQFIYGNAADSLFSKEQASITEKENIVCSGFSAQQVEATANSIGYNFDGVHKPQNDKDHYSLAYAEFVVPLVKAIQEQQAIIEKMQQQIDALTKK